MCSTADIVSDQGGRKLRLEERIRATILVVLFSYIDKKSFMSFLTARKKEGLLLYAKKVHLLLFQ